MSEQAQYHLYASRNMAVPDGVYSLIPTHGLYILILTDKTPPEGFTLIPDGTPLTEEERAWKLHSAMEINSRYLQEHKDEYAEFLNGFASALEKELSIEKQKIGEQPK